MGAFFERIIEPKAERLLARIFPIFKDKKEMRLASVHFMTHAVVGFTVAAISQHVGWGRWIAVGLVVWPLLEEWPDIKKKRYVDLVTRLLGWMYSLIALL